MALKAKRFPTGYDDVDLALTMLLDGARDVLGENFAGMYLFGSLALGDFSPDRSDIDPLITTGEPLKKRKTDELRIMHGNLCDSGQPWMRRMSGLYIPESDLRRYSPDGPECAFFLKDAFDTGICDSDWIFHRHVLYHHGIVITGPPLKDLIDPVSPEELRKTAYEFLHDWGDLTYDDEVFRGEGNQQYFVLTVCRSLYTFRNGDVTTKMKSAAWALNTLDSEWAGLIRDAMNWRFGIPHGDIPRTQRFMRYVMSEAGIQISTCP